MKFEDTSYDEIIEKQLGWDDFEDDRMQIAERLSGYSAERSEEEWENLFKFRYLNGRESGDVLCDPTDKGRHKLDFYAMEFTEFARIGLAGGDPHHDFCDRYFYGKSYEEIDLIIQDVSNDGIYAVYLKDYSFGYIRSFGDCVYILDDWGIEYDPDDPVAGIELLLGTLILTGEIDLEKELYDYYHHIPDFPSCKGLIPADAVVGVKEAASMLGVSEARVKKLASDRVLDGFKIGDERGLWLLRDQVEERIAYIAEHGKPTRGKSKESRKAKAERNER